MDNKQPTKRRVTRVRSGIEGDQKLQPDEDLMYDKKTGNYYAVKKQPKDVNAHKKWSK